MSMSKSILKAEENQLLDFRMQEQKSPLLEQAKEPDDCDDAISDEDQPKMAETEVQNAVGYSMIDPK